ncbi:hypothetical protein [Chamaesiphon polymorphus]|uniref:hypothetical protein n=1 Tax=Chamaesiphon polymorphus TaxID=2107691 RepID=UPI0011B2055C|nr:hypothetical protein [Chamaesiphon polymorphus]
MVSSAIDLWVCGMPNDGLSTCAYHKYTGSGCQHERVVRSCSSGMIRSAARMKSIMAEFSGWVMKTIRSIQVAARATILQKRRYANARMQVVQIGLSSLVIIKLFYPIN